MSKEILFDEEARKKLVNGIDAVANAVKSTLGPKGRNVIIGGKTSAPQVINDGVSIAKEIELEDSIENIGAQLVKDVSSKTNDVAGDGTSTAAVLVQAIVKEGIKNVTAGSNPIGIKRGIDKAVEVVVEKIKERAQKVSSKDDLLNIASVSAGNNSVIGELIAEAIDTVGADGVVTVSESKTTQTELKVMEGMQFERGYISPYFVTDQEKLEATYDDAYILCVNKKINLANDLLPVLEPVVQSGKGLLIIAEDIEGEALATLIVNTMRKILKVVAVRCPGFTDTKKDILQDISILTGATMFSEELGLALDKFTVNQLGIAKRVIVTKDNTTIIAQDDMKLKSELIEHIEIIKKQFELVDNKWLKDQLANRLARLTSGVAVINVGASTELELKDKKLRIEDALNATRAAIEEGIVAGGGTTLAQISNKISSKKYKLDEDEKVGFNIVLTALNAPLKQIAINSGKSGDVVYNKVIKNKVDCGYNALTDKYENLIEMGVIDPAKVERVALESAASIAGMILTAGCVVSDKPEQTQQLQIPQMY